MLCINDLPKAFTDKENLLYLSKLKLGNISVREELIAHNLRLVAMVLDRYIKENTEEKEDLFEVGVIGLIKAIDNFDFRFGAKLSTYAVPFIIGEIRRYIYENRSLLHITRSIKKQSLSILKFEEEYFAIHGKHPTNEVIKKEFGIDEYTLMMAKNSVKTISSIQAPIVDVEERPFEDVLASGKDDFERMVKKIDIEAVLSQLNSKQQQVFRCRYVEGLTQIETAKILKISQAQVSRLESNMLKKIRVNFSLANISDSSNVSYQGSEEELKRKSIVERAKKQLLITFFPSNLKEIVEAIHKAQLSEEEKKYLICLFPFYCKNKSTKKTIAKKTGLTKDELEMFTNNILVKVRENLNHKKKKVETKKENKNLIKSSIDFFNLFPGYSKEDILERFEYLSDNEKK